MGKHHLRQGHEQHQARLRERLSGVRHRARGFGSGRARVRARGLGFGKARVRVGAEVRRGGAGLTLTCVRWPTKCKAECAVTVATSVQSAREAHHATPVNQSGPAPPTHQCHSAENGRTGCEISRNTCRTGFGDELQFFFVRFGVGGGAGGPCVLGGECALVRWREPKHA